MRNCAGVAILLGFAALLTVSRADADVVRVKDWSYQDLGHGTYLGATTNESGSAFGISCGGGKCVTFLAADTGCEQGNTYSLLVSSDSGANAYDAICQSINGPDEKPRFAMFFGDFQNMLTRILKDHTIGIAIAMSGGQFKVCRFSLEGSNEVISAIRQAMLPSGNGGSSSRPASLGDQIL